MFPTFQYETNLPAVLFWGSRVSLIHPLGDHTRGPVPGVQTVQGSMNGPLVSVMGNCSRFGAMEIHIDFLMCFHGKSDP